MRSFTTQSKLGLKMALSIEGIREWCLSLWYPLGTLDGSPERSPFRESYILAGVNSYPFDRNFKK